MVTLTLRSVKGSPLTNNEVDANFSNLNAAVQPSGGTAGQVLAKIDGTDYNSQWIDNYSEALHVTVKAGVALTKGQAVYISGATGDNIIVSKAQANAESTSSKTFGLINNTLALNDFGSVITEGPITGIDTSAATEGDPVWLSPTTAGGLVFGVANKPVAPYHMVYLGVVSRAHATQGVIQVKVQNGYELDELHDVAISTPTGEYTQELSYQASTGLWKNYTKSTSTIAEGTNLYYTDARARNALSAGTGISYSSSTGVITNSAPDQVVSLTGTGTTTVTGTYPNFTVSSADQYSGTVTSVSGTGSVSGLTLTGTVTTSGSLTLGGTLDLSSPPTIGNTTPNTGTFTILTATGDSAFTSTGALAISKGTTAQQPASPVTGMIRYNTSNNQFEGYSGSSPAWKSIGGSALSNDTSTSTNLYPVFAGATSGTAENLYTSNAKLLYKPSTGELQASELVASNGIIVNSQTVSASYVIPVGSSASSVGPITIATGQTVTVSSGSRWIII